MAAVAPQRSPERPPKAPRKRPAETPAKAPVAVDAPESAPRPRPRAERRPHMAGGVAWIFVIGALLAGVVFMNVAVLRLNIRLDQLGRDRTRLRADTAQLASQLSSAQAAARIQALARKELGVQPALAQETTYVRLKP